MRGIKERFIRIVARLKKLRKKFFNHRGAYL